MISISNFLKHYYLLYPIPTILREIKECLPEGYEERELIKRLADFNIDDSHSDDFIRIHVDNYMIELFLAARETVEEKLGPEVADRYEDGILNNNISFDIYKDILPNGADTHILFQLEEAFNKFKHM